MKPAREGKPVGGRMAFEALESKFSDSVCCMWTVHALIHLRAICRKIFRYASTLNRSTFEFLIEERILAIVISSDCESTKHADGQSSCSPSRRHSSESRRCENKEINQIDSYIDRHSASLTEIPLGRRCCLRKSPNSSYNVKRTTSLIISVSWKLNAHSLIALQIN